MELNVKPPCVNRSQADFDVEDGALLYALGALKNVGVEAMRHVVDIREEGGPFKDLFDFAKRVNTRIVNKRCFENLARGGAFDALEPNRAKAFASASILQSVGSRATQERESDQGGLFGETVAMAEPELPEPAAWSLVEKLNHELGAIGFYFDGHPLEDYERELIRDKVVFFSDIGKYASGRKIITMAGVVRNRQERISQRSKKKFAYLGLSDATGEYEAFVGDKLLATSRDIMKAGSIIKLRVRVDDRDGEYRITAESVSSFGVGGPKEQILKGIKVRLRVASDESLDDLQEAIEAVAAVPSINMGKVRIIAPLGEGREAVWDLKQKIGVDKKARAALKSSRFVETIEEVYE